MTRGTWALGLSLTLIWVGCSDDEDRNIGPTGGAPSGGGPGDYTGGRPDTGGRPGTGGSDTGGKATGGRAPESTGGYGGVIDPGIGGVNDSGGAPGAQDCIGIAGEASCEASGCNPLTAVITHIAGELAGAGGAGSNGLDCGGGRSAGAEFIGCVLGSGGATLECHCQPGTDRCVEAGPEVGWLEGWEPSEKCRACGGL
jgi:hypothetical protein